MARADSETPSGRIINSMTITSVRTLTVLAYESNLASSLFMASAFRSSIVEGTSPPLLQTLVEVATNVENPSFGWDSAWASMARRMPIPANMDLRLISSDSAAVLGKTLFPSLSTCWKAMYGVPPQCAMMEDRAVKNGNSCSVSSFLLDASPLSFW